MKETSYELLKDELKKQLGKNNEVKMTLYNSLACKDPKSLDLDYSSKNYLRNFLRALPLKWRAKTNTKEKVKTLALKAKVTREQTSDDSDSNRFGRGNQFGNGGNRFGKGRRNSFGNKGGESSKQKRVFYNCEIEGHFASECTKIKEDKAFVGRAWSDSEDRDELQNDTTCLLAIDSQEVQAKPSISNNDLDIIDLQKENEELLRFNKDFTKTFEKLLKEK
ncbi:serine/threonine protein kinase SRPK1 [Tanacetum coccineum]